jgi:hypothetical protein
MQQIEHISKFVMWQDHENPILISHRFENFQWLTYLRLVFLLIVSDSLHVSFELTPMWQFLTRVSMVTKKPKLIAWLINETINFIVFIFSLLLPPFQKTLISYMYVEYVGFTWWSLFLIGHLYLRALLNQPHIG